MFHLSLVLLSAQLLHKFYLLLMSSPCYHAMARDSAVVAVPTTSDIVGVPAIDGVLAVANVPAALFPLLLAILLLLSSLLLLECKL
jgi:hypothetical protein